MTDDEYGLGGPSTFEQEQAALREELTKRFHEILTGYLSRKLEPQIIEEHLRQTTADFVQRGLEATPEDLDIYVLVHRFDLGQVEVVDFSALRQMFADGSINDYAMTPRARDRSNEYRGEAR